MTQELRPDGKTAAGAPIWRVLPGRELGQQTGLRHLIWAGPGHAVHLYDGGSIAEDGWEHLGRDAGAVGGRCETSTEARQWVYAYLVGLAQEPPPPWLGEILRAAGDISPAAATETRRAAEYGYHTHGNHGAAWAEWAARNYAKGALAGIATENDPAVQAALRASREARDQADRLLAAAAGPDGRVEVGLGNPESLAAYEADHEAEAWHGEYHEVHGAAYLRHDLQVSLAWREPDLRFLRSHRAELGAADPEGLADALDSFAMTPDDLTGSTLSQVAWARVHGQPDVYWGTVLTTGQQFTIWNNREHGSWSVFPGLLDEDQAWHGTPVGRAQSMGAARALPENHIAAPADWQADLLSGSPTDIPDYIAAGAHSARPGSPHTAGLGAGIPVDFPEPAHPAAPARNGAAARPPAVTHPQAATRPKGAAL